MSDVHETVFNRYDIRGTYPDEIDEAFAYRLGRAAGTYAQQHQLGTFVVGRDSREHAETISEEFINGVRSTGINVIDVGEGTTDRTALATQDRGGIGAMITASHHGWERTGFKFLYGEGYGFSNDDLAAIKQLYRSEDFVSGSGTLLREHHEFDETYIERLVESARTYSDGIDGTIVLDTAGGVGRTAEFVFEDMGADVITVERDTLPAPEPTATSRKDTEEMLSEHEADLAVGFDPDADRVYAIHPEQGWIDGDRLLYVLAQIIGAETIVASLDTSPMIEELDADITYTRVGDIFVAAEGYEQDADLLGEPNGHYAVTDFCWYNSGLFAAVLLAAHHDELAALLEPVAEYRAERQVVEYGTIEARDDAMRSAMKAVAKNYEITSTDDGYRFRGEDFVGLVRPSGTSPKIRLVVHTTADIDVDAIAARVLPDA